MERPSQRCKARDLSWLAIKHEVDRKDLEYFETRMASQVQFPNHSGPCTARKLSL